MLSDVFPNNSPAVILENWIMLVTCLSVVVVLAM